MERKLFCEISPFTYRLSMEKEILKRHVRDMLRKTQFARERTEDSLPVVVYRHNSLIRRRLGNVNMQLQENKATNLALAVKHIDGLVIHPGETFSVWKLIGRTTKRKGYKESRSTITTMDSTSSPTLAARFPSVPAPASLTTISTTASATIPRTPINSDFGRMKNTCAANFGLRSNSHIPSTSMPRTNTSRVRTVWSIATGRSIVTSSTASQESALKASSSEPTMPG